METFLAFVNCSKMSGEDVANLILETIQRYNIPISDCRAQGYDNGSNMRDHTKVHKLAFFKLIDWQYFFLVHVICSVHAAESLY